MEANIIEGTPSLSPANREKTAKLLLWLGIISISMLFAGLTSGYIVRRGAGTWLSFQLPMAFYISTAIIIMSSVTMNMALQAIKKGSNKAVSRAVLLTLILGVVFGISQFTGYSELVKAKIFLTGSTSNASGSFLYIISFVHLGHLLGGLVALSIVFVKSLMGKYTTQNHLGIKLCAIYWHFLDGLWVYLFLFMYLFR